MNYFFNNHIESEQLYLYSGGYEPTAKGHVYGPTVRSGYMLHYIYKGKGKFTSGNQTYNLGPDDFFFIEPNLPIKYVADSEDPWVFYWIGFRGTLAKEYLQRTTITYNNPIFKNSNSLQIKELLSEMIEISYVHQDNDILLNGKLLEILFQMVSHFPVEQTQPRSKKSQLLTEAIQFMRNNYEHNLQINEIAEALRIDRTYLHRLFQNELETSPKEYLTALRVRKAQKLLTESDLPVKVISYSVGYENTQQFSRVFKKNTGFSPRDFRLTTE
ncbi:AraC family transcriptional regulator [Enterococcus sp. LJL90]